MPLSQINTNSIANNSIVAADMVLYTLTANTLANNVIGTNQLSANLTLSGTTTANTLVSNKITDTLGNSFAPASSVFRNRIINGAMVIAQYGTSSVSVQTTTTYSGVDRFKAVASQNSKFTVQQNAGSVTPPVGFSNYLGCTSSSAYSLAAGDYFSNQQVIEGFNTADFAWGTANAKTITVSFWVYASLTGTYSFSIRNYGSYNRSYVASYTVSSANTWQQISITIAGDTTGTWTGATNSGSLLLDWGIGVGSTYSTTTGSWQAGNYFGATGATSVVGTSSATFYITGVQLEVGTNATNFDYRPYGTELQLCQRYAYVITQGGNFRYAIDGNSGGTTSYPTTHFKTTMRAAPTMTYSSLSNFMFETYSSIPISVTNLQLNLSTIDQYVFTVTTSSSTSVGGHLYGTGAGAQMIFSAEL